MGHNEVEALGFMFAACWTDTLLWGAVEVHRKALVAKTPSRLGAIKQLKSHVGLLIASPVVVSLFSGESVGSFRRRRLNHSGRSNFAARCRT
jgi:hypothetical protein